MEKPLVLVTGAAGFVGSHCVKVLLENGFNVRGTVKSLENRQSYEHLFKFQNNNSGTNLDLI